MSSKEHKGKKYYVLHHSALRLSQRKGKNNTQLNIFTELDEGNEDFFSNEGSMESPFTLTQAQEKKQYPALEHHALLIKPKVNQSPQTKLHTQTIYKLSKASSRDLTNRQKHSHSPGSETKQLTSQKYKMPAILTKSGFSIQKSGSSSLNLSNRLQKIDEKIQKYLYHHSIINQVAFNQDLRTRCGDQYFQQLLRERHKDESKPIPYVYSLKNNVSPMYSPFVKRVAQKHPQIKLREKMKLIGVNRLRIKTETDSEEIILKNHTRIQANTFRNRAQMNTQPSF